MTSKRLFIGIDPGLSGGIAIRDEDGLAEAFKMPITEGDTRDLLEDCMARVGAGNVSAVVESVHSFPGQGVSSSFAFGRHYGLLRGLLIGLRIPFIEVTPGTWQKVMGCISRGKVGKTEKKNQTKARCQQLFPQLKINHAVADALLIADFARRTAK